MLEFRYGSDPNLTDPSKIWFGGMADLRKKYLMQ
jgi:hypothetical protein